MNEIFTKMGEVHSAILDIDRIVESNSTDKFDDVVNAIKNIDRKTLDESIISSVIDGIRSALYKRYQDLSTSANNDLNPKINYRGVVVDPAIKDPDVKVILD